MTLTSILPDMLALAEAAFGPRTGPQKQEAVIGAITKGLTDAGVPAWIVKVLAALLEMAIPALIKKYNADPANTTFTPSA